MKTKTIKVDNYSFKIKIDPNMPDYSKDPFFVKKYKDALAFFKKHPHLARGNKLNEE